ncbi:MAG: flagellar motor switch protein FliN/FliY [Candidatus Latescibacterota bacterium]|jgi:flagellar motor switch protein FliN
MNDKKRHMPAMKKSDLPAVLDMGQISALQDVDVRITVEWGRAKITVEEAVSLGEKSLLRTDKLAPDPVDILVNDKLFARGKLVVVGDSYGVQILEIVQ